MLKEELTVPLNLEMAATEEMLDIAVRTKPNAVCLVPEKRQEITTEGGLNIEKYFDYLKDYIKIIKEQNIRVSLFLEPEIKMIDLAQKLQTDIIEFHTGRYCNLAADKRKQEFDKIAVAVAYANSLNIECHAGHGLNYQSAAEISKIAAIKELNIGHFLIGEAIFLGLNEAINKMKQAIKR